MNRREQTMNTATVRSLYRNEHGASGVILALALAALAGIAALSLDLGVLHVRRSSLQTSADAAASSSATKPSRAKISRPVSWPFFARSAAASASPFALAAAASARHRSNTSCVSGVRASTAFRASSISSSTAGLLAASASRSSFICDFRTYPGGRACLFSSVCVF